MDRSNRDRTPPGLEAVAARLRAERATATPLDLDRIKVRAMRQAKRTQRSLFARQKGIFVKSRLALTLVIAAGFTLSTTGATLAITGSSGNGSASSAQYQQVLPISEEGGSRNPESLGGSAATTRPVAAEQAEVVSETSGSLPFTGFLAIPLLVLGVALMGSGAFLHRRLRRHERTTA
jgi:hypothetical protein